MKEVFQYVPLVGFQCPVCLAKTDINGHCMCFGVVSQCVRKLYTEDDLEYADALGRKMSNP
jgi:hypothetical protein